ncbi:MAG: GIY-YIG nuclease family protein [Bacteroidia bacterium]|nr:GIY-YIG nuclease family protein [Bacteroidia bacterium]
MLYAILDLETTGGNAIHDKITEVAVYLHDGTSVIKEYSSLINPECSIPPFISRLTGIDNEMVRDAPKFYEVAKEIIELTEGATVVAHNALFDYSFLAQEYKSLGYTFSRDYLCTVRLSRKIIPGYRSYSLGTLCNTLGIPLHNRHRAAGDALATVKLFELLLSKDPEKIYFSSFAKNDYLNLRFPPEFDRNILDKLPEAPGVYYFHNADNSVVYIGKSNNIKKRVLSHFSNKQTRKAIELRNSIRDISFEVTGNELVALLLESEEIKSNQPLYNRSQKGTFFNYGIFKKQNDAGYITLSSGRVKTSDRPVVITRTHDECKSILEHITEKFELCQKLTGLYDISHACFQHSINRCNGACIGKEDVNIYNDRVNAALKSLEYKHSNFMIIGPGRTSTERTVVQVEDGRYIGFGFFEPEFTGQAIDVLKDVVVPRQDNRDVHRIIRYHLHQKSNDVLLTY